MSTMKGKTLCFTGTLESQTRAEATKAAQAAGAKVAKTVTKSVDIVICGPGAGAKKKQAEDKGCEIWTEQEFLEAVQGKPASKKKTEKAATSEKKRDSPSPEKEEEEKQETPSSRKKQKVQTKPRGPTPADWERLARLLQPSKREDDDSKAKRHAQVLEILTDLPRLADMPNGNDQKPALWHLLRQGASLEIVTKVHELDSFALGCLACHLRHELTPIMKAIDLPTAKFLMEAMKENDYRLMTHLFEVDHEIHHGTSDDDDDKGKLSPEDWFQIEKIVVDRSFQAAVRAGGHKLDCYINEMLLTCPSAQLLEYFCGQFPKSVRTVTLPERQVDAALAKALLQIVPQLEDLTVVTGQQWTLEAWIAFWQGVASLKGCDKLKDLHIYIDSEQLLQQGDTKEGVLVALEKALYVLSGQSLERLKVTGRILEDPTETRDDELVHCMAKGLHTYSEGLEQLELEHFRLTSGQPIEKLLKEVAKNVTLTCLEVDSDKKPVKRKKMECTKGECNVTLHHFSGPKEVLDHLKQDEGAQSKSSPPCATAKGRKKRGRA